MTTPKIGPSDKAGLSDLPSSAQRTPGPWKVVSGSPYKGSSVNIVNQQGDYVALVGHEQNCDADAKFIVRACNAHDELVTALRDIVAFTESGLPAPKGQMYRWHIEQIARAALARIEK